MKSDEYKYNEEVHKQLAELVKQIAPSVYNHEEVMTAFLAAILKGKDVLMIDMP